MQLKCLVALLLFHTAGMAQYNSLLWKITGRGLAQPSYLFGTMHTSQAGIIEKGDSATRYMLQTSLFAMELDVTNDVDYSIMQKLMMPAGQSIKKMIPEKEYLRLDSLLVAQLGVSAIVFDNMAPIFLVTILETMGEGSPQKAVVEKSLPLDLYLRQIAVQQGIPVLGIETIDEQLQALNSVSYTQQANMLVSALRMLSKADADMQQIIALYRAHNLDSLMILSNDTTMPPAFNKAILTKRNVRMADRIYKQVKKQSTFVAIGALHLPGKDGVVALLRKKGLRLEPCPF